MTLDELKNYVTSNKRICPVPTVWNKFLDVLEIKERMPPNLIPLILNGWTASDLEKRKRLLAQIEYASKNVVILKKLEQGLLINTGHYRNGILLAPACAEWIGDQIDRYQ